MGRFITGEKLIKISRKYLRLIFEFEQRFSDLLGGEMDNVNWRGLLPRGGGRGRGLDPLQLLDGQRHRGRGGGGGRVLLVRRQLTGGNIGAAAQHQPRVYGGGRAGMEDIIENTEVTQLHQVLGFQIDHWFVLTLGSLFAGFLMLLTGQPEETRRVQAGIFTYLGCKLTAW